MSISRIKPTGWSFFEKLTSPQATQLDVNVSNAVDKTAAGDTVSGTLTFASGAGTTYSSGSTQTLSSGATAYIRGVLRTESGGRITLADNDYPTFGVGHTGTSMTRKYAMGAVPRATGVGVTVNDENVQLAVGGACLFYLPTHHGATLSSVEVRFIASTGHAALPATNMYVSLNRRSNPVGGSPAFASLRAAGSVSYAPVSLADYNNGNIKSVTFTADQNNVVDRTTYSYELFIAGESSTNAAAILVPEVRLNFTSIADMRFA